jgi:S-adenosyl methyltransferase
VTEPAKVDTSRPNNARVYDYLLGGRDNFAVDRTLAERMASLHPAARGSVRAQRYVLARVVRYLVREEGVTQLLDIGSGLPTAQNVHQIAQRVNEDVRVVYLDNDPVVISHATALLADDKRTFALKGDLRDPEGVLNSARELLDWNQPIGLVLCGILHFLSDEEKPAALMAMLIDALPSGSCVFINHMVQTDESASLESVMRQGLGRVRFRTRAQILELFGGLELVEPGLVPAQDWRPDGPAADPPLISLSCSGVAKKPLLLITGRGAWSGSWFLARPSRARRLRRVRPPQRRTPPGTTRYPPGTRPRPGR